MPVKVIRANPGGTAKQQETQETITRVAAYCRVSTDSDEQQGSYEVQVSHFTEYVSAHPDWILVKVYADEGISGTSLKNRTEFNKMIRDCENGKIDMVLTKSISRWARNTVDSLQTIRHLKELNIGVFFEKENIYTLDAKGEVLITIMSSIAQQESDSISKNVRLGIQYLMQQGKGHMNTSRFLGYGKAPGDLHKLIILPKEASIVRRIYREYLEGYSPGMIAQHLTTDRIPTPGGKEVWYQSTISSILENEKYCGDLLMQKYYVTDFLTHKVAKNTGQLPQYLVENDHEPIIPKEIFYQVQGEIQRRAMLKYEPNSIRFGSRNALTGRLVCGLCGNILKEVKGPVKIDWRCRKRAGEKRSDYREGKAKCSCPNVPTETIQGVIITALNLVPEYRDELIRLQGSLRDGDIKRIDSVVEENRERQKRFAEKIAVISNSTDPHDSEGHDVEWLTSELERLEEEETQLILERAEAAYQDVQITLLLEFLSLLSPATVPDAGGAEEAPERTRVSRRASAAERKSAAEACYTYEDFFRRTMVKPGPGVLVDGKVVGFDNTLVVRYLEKVIVKPDGYEVWFKAGICISVPRA